MATPDPVRADRHRQLTGQLRALGALLAYPDEESVHRLARARRTLSSLDPEGAEGLATLQQHVAGFDTWQLEELYTRTFDLDPVATLEAGWHLYGEQYERGRFLVRCRELLRQAGIDEGCELPDHLASLLSALPQLHDDDLPVFAASVLAPASGAIAEALRKRDNPYAPLLEAIERLVRELAGDLPLAQLARPEDRELVQIGRTATPRSTP